VFGPVRHVGALAQSVATRRSRARDDAEALRELESDTVELPAGLSVQWLGVSGYRLDFEGHSLYIDPYVSRVPLRSLVLRRPARPDPAAHARFLPPPGGEVVGVAFVIELGFLNGREQLDGYDVSSLITY